MADIRIYQIDAFADALFTGNPAAVCVLDAWLPQATLQAIAAENNLSETAFIVRADDGWTLRWMTPETEVALCGHATLASGYVVFTHLDPAAERVVFHTKSGPLVVEREDDQLAIDLPASRPSRLPDDHPLARAVAAAIGRPATELWSARKAMAVLESESDVRALRPDMALVAALDAFGLIVTAPGDESGVDFVSRFFAPAVGVPEDPVTGAAHCVLTPYWAERLDKRELRARQVSRRGGALLCRERGDRVTLVGRAVEYLEGRLRVES